MTPLLDDDPYWIAAAAFLKGRVAPSDMIIAPSEFRRTFGQSAYYSASHYLAAEAFRFVVVHKGMLHYFNPAFLRAVVPAWQPIFANEVFVVLDRDAAPPGLLARLTADKDLLRHSAALHAAVEALPVLREPTAPEREAILINTYNRSWALARSLPAAAAFHRPLLVVDDGSDADEAAANREVCQRSGAAYLALPGNRGLPAAMTPGQSYFLANPDIAWIVALQDDVVLAPGTFEALHAVRDARTRPILTTYFNELFPVDRHEIIGGQAVRFQVSAAGPMLYAHRDYWRDVLPIPTPYLGAPKATGPHGGQGSDTDFWVTCWAPKSAGRRGLHVACLPDIRASHLADDPALSTWRATDISADDSEHAIDDDGMERAFTRTYERHAWGSPETDADRFFSGLGSHDPGVVATYVAAVREAVASLGGKLDAVDLGCGDFAVGSQLRPLFGRYTACDIVEPLIVFNRQRHAALDVDFRHLDLTRDELPPGDIVFVRQVFQHLSNDHIARALRAIAARYKYLVLTESLPSLDNFRANIDILSGSNLRLGLDSGVVVTRPPFDLAVREARRLCTASHGKAIITTDFYRLT